MTPTAKAPTATDASSGGVVFSYKLSVLAPGMGHIIRFGWITRGVSGPAVQSLLSGHGTSLGGQVSHGEPAGRRSQAVGQASVAWAAAGARPPTAAPDAG